MAELNDSLDPRDPEIEYADAALREGYYGTGSTEPPKDYMGVTSLVLVLLISFSSLISALGLMNIQVFQVPQTSEPSAVLSVQGGEPANPIGSGDLRLEEKDSASAETRPLEPQGGESLGTHLQLQTAPQGLENVEPIPGAIPWQDVYEQVMPSVVSITAVSRRSSSTGTGVIMDEKGFIITNAHVVEDATTITVLLTDGRTLNATCVGADLLSDLAVLRVKGSDLVAAQFGDSSTLRVGDSVVAIGDPLGAELRGTMTNGIISGINRDMKVGSRTMTLLQTTAALNAGNSGGPLVNCYGQVVGINTMKIGDYASSAGVEGLGFAIPMTTVQVVVEQLASQGYVEGRPTIGIEGEAVDAFYQIYYRMPAGLRITAISAGSNAAQQGVRRGDILLSLNGRDIRSMSDLEEIVYASAVDETLKAVFYRDGMEFDLTIVVQEEHK